MSELKSRCCGFGVYSVPIYCGYTKLITGCEKCAKMGDAWYCSKCNKPAGVKEIVANKLITRPLIK